MFCMEGREEGEAEGKEKWTGRRICCRRGGGKAELNKNNWRERKEA